MRSTGEVMGSDTTFARAFLKAQLGAGTDLPTGGKVFLSIKDDDKTPAMQDAAKTLADLGFALVATRGTGAWLKKAGIACDIVNKVYEGRPNIVDMLKDGDITLVLNTTEGAQSIEDSREMRSVALYDKIAYYTTAAGAQAAAQAIAARNDGDMIVTSLQELAQ
jgi:carbamoyl-phosphate synthase large subunit